MVSAVDDCTLYNQIKIPIDFFRPNMVIWNVLQNKCILIFCNSTYCPMSFRLLSTKIFELHCNNCLLTTNWTYRNNDIVWDRFRLLVPQFNSLRGRSPLTFLNI